MARSPLWNNGPIDDPLVWAREMETLLDNERAEEQREVDDKLTSLSAADAQAAGLTVLGLRILEKSAALFNRASYKVRRCTP